MTKPKDLLTPELCQRFITLPGERLIIAKREHWFVKKLKEYVLFRMIPTLPGFAPENFPHPEGLLDHADEFSSLFEIQRRQIIRKLIRPVKRRLGLPDYEPVWHKQVQNEMARWGKEDLGLSEKQYSLSNKKQRGEPFSQKINSSGKTGWVNYLISSFQLK